MTAVYSRDTGLFLVLQIFEIGLHRILMPLLDLLHQC